MKSITVHLEDDRVLSRVTARAAEAGLPLDTFVRQEIRHVIAQAGEPGGLPPITQKYAGIGVPMTDADFREFRRGYLTRKYQ